VNSESIPSHPISVPAKSAELAYRAYAALADTFPFDADFGLGGKLLYAGEIGSQSRDLLFAANIAGAASLAATADPAAQRGAIRDGVIDFSVTSVEEALRILKNEIRKRQAVSVAVSMDPERLVEQMLDRGVLPDILPSFVHDRTARFIAQGARQILDSDREGGEFVSWSVDREFNRWLPKLDGCVQAVIPENDYPR
jgi:urocanate hydratase